MEGPYSSLRSAFEISFPFNPTLLKESPSQTIRQYEAENAMPLKPRDAIRGSPSPTNTVQINPRHAPTMVKREMNHPVVIFCVIS